jgi:hypothetical protein
LSNVWLAVPPLQQTATSAGSSDWSTRWLKEASLTSGMDEKQVMTLTRT